MLSFSISKWGELLDVWIWWPCFVFVMEVQLSASNLPFACTGTGWTEVGPAKLLTPEEVSYPWLAMNLIKTPVFQIPLAHRSVQNT
jgi:hypothetical protein